MLYWASSRDRDGMEDDSMADNTDSIASSCGMADANRGTRCAHTRYTDYSCRNDMYNVL